jgi:hypothetical protein
MRWLAPGLSLIFCDPAFATVVLRCDGHLRSSIFENAELIAGIQSVVIDDASRTVHASGYDGPLRITRLDIHWVEFSDKQILGSVNRPILRG